ncbi:MAG: DUF1552 domain-containing protein [Myxococcota bacterium]|nr:DUF1552 domain-containing protein [Myxococcota bacterium]
MRRRQFLGWAGGALALPLLQVPRRAWAQEQDYPVRLVVFYQPNGTKKELWSPTAGSTETQFDLGPLLKPLEAHKQDMVLIDGLDMLIAGQGPGGPHQRGMASVLSGAEISTGSFIGGDGRAAGWGGGITIDQEMVRVRQPRTALSSLELGVRVKQAIPRSRLIYRGPQQPVPPENNPVAVYERIFGGQGTTALDPAAAQRRLTRRQSVLDFVNGDFRALMGQVARADRLKLEQHADALRDLERRLGRMTDTNGACHPELTQHGDIMSETEFRQVLRAQIDLMVSAMACDVTRVGSLQCSSSVNALRFTFMDLKDHEGHSLSHAGDSNELMQGQWERMLLWYSEQFNYLLDALAAVPEGDGTMLDNTLVLAVNEISRGNSHSHDDMPFILAGRAGGRLRTGRYLNYGGHSHTDLLVSVLNLVGVDTATFGDPRFCQGPLVGLV